MFLLMVCLRINDESIDSCANICRRATVYNFLYLMIFLLCLMILLIVMKRW